ncbi:MAG TPA: DUF4157 domain-containing protein [Bacteroidetes bacterium]|nr:DUF4157 domain-containing protein [Bacteroidota bacterium]
MERLENRPAKVGAQASQMQHAESESGGKTLAPPPFQLMASDVSQPPPPKNNNTGLPDNLKSGIETMSGMSMDDVKVHRNSAEPGKVGAHAFAQGSDIHVANGQEQHLAHEAWHVVQQKQGRVQATTSVGGLAVNDNVSLESEADTMGAKALQMKADQPALAMDNPSQNQGPGLIQGKFQAGSVAQLARQETQGQITYDTEDFQYRLEDKLRERTSRVVMAGKNPKNNDPANHPISYMNMDTGLWDDMEGLHKGHVAAAFMGGWNASYNIVPMIAGFNMGPWAAEERNISNELDLGNEVTITPNYGVAFDTRFPNSISVSSTGGYNNTIDHKAPTRTGTSDEVEDHLNETMNDADSKNYALGVLENAKDRGMIPANYMLSPYLKLDVAWLAGSIGEGNPGPRTSFKGWQLDWIIRYNTRLNGGFMVSDAWKEGSNEPHENLRENGRLDRPEVDHIIPNSRGGSNFFTNARLVSWELNNKIERVVDAGAKFLKW